MPSITFNVYVRLIKENNNAKFNDRRKQRNLKK